MSQSWSLEQVLPPEVCALNKTDSPPSSRNEEWPLGSPATFQDALSTGTHSFGFYEERCWAASSPFSQGSRVWRSHSAPERGIQERSVGGKNKQSLQAQLRAPEVALLVGGAELPFAFPLIVPCLTSGNSPGWRPWVSCGKGAELLVFASAPRPEGPQTGVFLQLGPGPSSAPTPD